jgi:hypothetical protein
MCRGGRLVADFVAGTAARPGLPEELDEHLTTTVTGLWVVWAHKLARPMGDLFVPLTGGSGYPADARAECRRQGVRRAHDAPDPRCTCGFHALSTRGLPGLPAGHGFTALAVALSGRVLALEWFASSARPGSSGQNQSRASAAIPVIPTVAPLLSPLPHLAIRGRCG